MPKSVIFLDRDGTINVDHGYVHRIQDWEFIPGSIDAILRLRFAHYAIAIVSNQSAIAAGKYTLEDVTRLHAFVRAEFARHSATIDAIAICPHSSVNNCDCRKPRPGLARQIEKQLGHSIDYATSWTVGDKISDIGFGRALGTRTILLRSRYWQPGELTFQPDRIADSLLGASQTIAAVE